ncbi:hypothetical protein HYU11_02915 [Candidatus Woesearchaeota archaeon]|nr:hypothetical protein [Candidatus Woesearchaeota archaeon]
MRVKISKETANDVLNLALDTLRIGKQALIFAGTKQGAEKTAEEISKKAKTNDAELDKLSLQVLQSLSKPTKQCERLASCVKKGIAFHHSGLTHQQRAAVETGFREGKIRIICSTPTLAAGLDLPAYRSIIRDLKRYGNYGMDWIPVLEYLQMSGRAGRPKFDTEGQAIAFAGNDSDEIYKRYILGKPESIHSKLAVEPVLRTALLSLISTKFITTQNAIMDFFSKTFWAHQYGDMKNLGLTVSKILRQLEEWGFITSMEEFRSALDEDEKINATAIGKRVSELYLDPLTAHHLIQCMQKTETDETFPYLQMISSTLEMRPALRAGTRDHDNIQELLTKNEGKLLIEEPSPFDDEYGEFINSMKTAWFFQEWIEEKDEDYLLEKFRVRPGEIHSKLEIADWLLYSAIELGRMLLLRNTCRQLMKLRLRVKYGAKEELMQLLKLKGIGRARARRLFSHGIKDLAGIRKEGVQKLSEIVGSKIAEDIKKQAG